MTVKNDASEPQGGGKDGSLSSEYMTNPGSGPYLHGPELFYLYFKKNLTKQKYHVIIQTLYNKCYDKGEQYAAKNKNNKRNDNRRGTGNCALGG